MPVDCFAYRKMAITTAIDGRLKVVFVTSDIGVKNTVVEEVTFGRFFMRGLQVAAANFHK